MDILDIAVFYKSCQFQHVERMASSIAHAITKWDDQVEFDYVWEGSLPTILGSL